MDSTYSNITYTSIPNVYIILYNNRYYSNKSYCHIPEIQNTNNLYILVIKLCTFWIYIYNSSEKNFEQQDNFPYCRQNVQHFDCSSQRTDLQNASFRVLFCRVLHSGVACCFHNKPCNGHRVASHRQSDTLESLNSYSDRCEVFK